MKNFGFGCMRLPMLEGGEAVDLEQFKEMVDAFMAAGFTYFDTAHGYLKGKSETAIREGLVKRYPRESYILTDKLSGPYYEKEEDIRPLFQQQLECCGVEYFDYYLLHSMSEKSYAKAEACNAFEVCKELLAEGKIKHLGMSFHDGPELMDKILSAHPEIEVVQIQFNYADYDDPTVQSKAVYDVVRKYNKPLIIMEPVKGGSLADLVPEAAEAIAPVGGSPASAAIRYAASFEGVFMVLSGMSTLGQMEDNLSFMTDFKPLSAADFEAVDKVRAILKQQDVIPCTTCRYCEEGCPMQIPIPDLFKIMNNSKRFKNFRGANEYRFTTRDKGMASQCIGCRQCENICPQHLPITDLLKDVAAAFEEA